MNWCCQTWLDLGPELSELKVKSLDKLLKRGIPRSTFSPVFRLIEGMTNYCPLCGTRISSSEPLLPVKKEAPKPPVSNTPPSIPCPICRGTGRVGGDANCMTCLGSGKLTKANPNRKSYDKEYAKELADQMDGKEEARAKLEKKLRDNPQPLRDDAKPENWGM